MIPLASGELVTSIYTLHAPDGEIRYVGKTVLPIEQRLSRHISNANRGGSSYCAYWIRSLLRDGHRPSVMLVETVVGDGWAEAERYWVARLRAEGVKITNLTDGGEGTPGHRQSVETRARRSVSQTGKKHSAETRAKLSDAAKRRTPRTGWSHSTETRDQMSHVARSRDNSTGRAISISGRIVDPEVGSPGREYERPDSWRSAISVAKRGSRHHLAKLDEQSVAEIKALLLGRELTQTEIGSRYGVSREAVSLIQRNQRWAHVPWPHQEVSPWQ